MEFQTFWLFAYNIRKELILVNAGFVEIHFQINSLKCCYSVVQLIEFNGTGTECLVDDSLRLAFGKRQNDNWILRGRMHVPAFLCEKEREKNEKLNFDL